MKRFIRFRLHSALLSILAIAFLVVPGVSSAQTVTSFKNYYTSKCMHSNDAGSVFPWDCTSGNTYQDWKIVFFDPMIGLVKNVKTGRCLTFAAGSKVPSTVPCGDGTASGLKWFIMPFGSDTAQPGYGLHHLQSALCLYNSPTGGNYYGATAAETSVSCGFYLSSRWKMIP